MFDRILVFGDSFSYGQGLDGTGEATIDPHPESWPYQLGKLYNKPVLNLSKPGASNKLIWHNIVNTIIRPTDLVINAWSCYQRTMVVTKYDNTPRQNYFEHNEQLVLHQHLREYGTWMEDDPVIMDYYMNHYTDIDAFLDTCILMDHAESYIKSITPYCFNAGIPNLGEFAMLTGDEDIITECGAETSSIDKAPHWMKSKMLTTMDIEGNDFPRACDGHLGLEGNIHFAERISKLILDEINK